MNIFYLDQDPKLCAQYHTDKHVVKMILESAQLLCTAINTLSGEQVTPYKSTHVNHPCSLWVRSSFDNWIYTYNLMEALEKEWQYRFNQTRRHLSVVKLIKCEPYEYKLPIFAGRPGILQHKGLTPPALAMPDYCKISSDPVECYREYYRKEKIELHKWTGRDRPYWI